MDFTQLITAGIRKKVESIVSERFHLTPKEASAVIAIALPLLIGALRKNASSKKGAVELTNAIQKDHSDTTLDELIGMLTNQSTQKDGSKIIQHVLGSRKTAVAKVVSKSTGINVDQAEQILEILSPVVLGALGKDINQTHNSHVVTEMLESLNNTQEKKTPKSTDIITQILDTNNNGSALDEIAHTAMQIFLKK